MVKDSVPLYHPDYHIFIVIYDNELTDALISTIVYLSTSIMETPPLIIIGMEKR